MIYYELGRYGGKFLKIKDGKKLRERKQAMTGRELSGWQEENHAC